MRLTAHFTIREVEHSTQAARFGIDNTLPQELMKVVLNTAIELEKVRMLLAAPISVDSWYRCQALNKAVKGAKYSQHMKGEAVDFTSEQFGSPLAICKKILVATPKIWFDQLILEHDWVHISFPANPIAIPRGEVLSLLNDKTYAKGLTDKEGNPYE